MAESDKIVHALDARYYTDPVIFKAEQNGLFLKSWQFAGHASQVEKPGIFTFELAGESLFCVKIETRKFVASIMFVCIVHMSCIWHRPF